MEKLKLINSFDKRSLELMYNSLVYAESDIQGGLPGHNLMNVITELCLLLGITQQDILEAIVEVDELLNNPIYISE